MADQNESVERARKELERDRETRERSAREYAERSKGKPTPTQEENDLHACGAHILEHEDDGSGPDPYDWRRDERHVEAGKGGKAQYQTRQAAPALPPKSPT